MSVAAVARRLFGAIAGKHRRPITAAVAECARQLEPRVVLVVGMPVPPSVRGSLLTIFLACGEAPVPAARDVRIFADDPVRFFDRPDLTLAAGPRSAKLPPEAFFDMVVLDPDCFPDAEEASIFLRRAVYLGGSSMVAVVTAPHTGGTAAIHASLIAARPTCQTLALPVTGGEARLYADLDEAAAAGSIAPSPPTTDLGQFLAKHRQRPLPLAPAGRPVPGAPQHASEIVQPEYRRPGIANPSDPTRARGTRGLASWWGRPLATLPLSVTEYREVRFLRASGRRRSVLVDSQGRALPDSYPWSGHYGPEAPTAARTAGTSFLLDENGRRLPLAAWNEVPVRRRVTRPAMLLGHLYSLFGHALLESQSRFWAIEWALGQDLAFVLWWDDPLLPFQEELLRLLDLPPGSIEVARHGTLFERLLVPSEGFRIMSSVAPAVADGWARIGAAAESEGDGRPTPRRIYLSRRHQRNRAIRNIDALEALLARHGFAIVVPEALPFAEQVRIVRGADLLVADFGSQSHLSMYMRPGTRKLIIAREYFSGPEETMIALATRTAVDFFIEPQRKGKSSIARAEPWTISLGPFAAALTAWLGEPHG